MISTRPIRAVRSTVTGLATVALISAFAIVAPTAARADDAAPTAPPSSTAETATHTCATGVLPPSIQGKPASFKAGLSRGYWIWHDGSGWHLRVTKKATDKKPVVFSGKIHTNRSSVAKAVRFDAKDRLHVSRNHHNIAFRLVNHGAVDGIDWVASCSERTTFTLRVNGHRITPTRIHLGSADAHPAHAHFMIRRTAVV